MFESLTQRLEKAVHSLRGRGRITESNITDTLKEVRRALIAADVNFKIAKEFTQNVQKKAIGQKVLTDLKPGQLLVKIVRDELAELMGGETATVNLSGNPSVILMSGLQGSGKTTFSGKLAKYLQEKQNRSVLLVGCDVYRPAALDQLEVLAGQIGASVYIERDCQDPVAIAKNALAYAKKNQKNTVIIDTAGRLAVDAVLMKEIENIYKAVKPSETFFVIDAMTGQDAVNTAKAFHDLLNFDGVVLTKLDGDTRGGAAISIKSVVNKPIKFVGTGEKMDALDVFHPDRMADRILGMGDVVSLVEKAQEQYDEKEAKRIQKRIAKNQFGFDDFLGQLEQVKKMGNFKDLVGMIPGASNMMKGAEIEDDSFKSIEAMIHSMTPDERRNPKIINSSRKKRIVMGSGTNIQELNKLMKQFSQMSKMMKMMQGGGVGKMMQMMNAMRR